MPACLHRSMYTSLDELLPSFNISMGMPSSRTLKGMEPPACTRLKLVLILCPDGRVVGCKPFAFRRCMSLLYGLSTCLLLALGQGVLDSHQTYSTESRSPILRTVTHSAGAGILAGLNQKHSCAR